MRRYNHLTTDQDQRDREGLVSNIWTEDITDPDNAPHTATYGGVTYTADGWSES